MDGLKYFNSNNQKSSKIIPEKISDTTDILNSDGDFNGQIKFNSNSIFIWQFKDINNSTGNWLKIGVLKNE